MIDLYTWPTPNGHKIHIMLEECGLPYRVHPINIGTGDQFKPEFLRISPNNKIPAIVDSEGPDGQPISLFESGAILLYLASKTGRFLPSGVRERYDVLQWLMFQMGGLGPMLGQAHHFRIYAPEKIDYAVNRYTQEAKRLYGVLNQQVGQHRFIAGDDYTIADIAIWPWYGALAKGLLYGAGEFLQVQEYTHVQRWANELAQRPAVQRGRMVNRVMGTPESQLHERHDASDFDTRTQDKLNKA